MKRIIWRIDTLLAIATVRAIENSAHRHNTTCTCSSCEYARYHARHVR